MKNIQIPYDLFVSLLRYHLLEINDCEAEIQIGLEKKLDALVMHDLYSRSKAAPTAEEREKARQEYLDKRGVPDSFRWSVSFDER
ncbi:MAG: complexin-2 [Lachnospiraceae bacterium]|nr:complexin-2 [Lachnospiraceae bacterium]